MVEKFPAKLARATKRSRGRTSVAQTPVAIRGNVPISPTVEDRVRRKLARRIGRAAPLVERGTVRFDDINGPRGGIDTECRIKLVLGGRPSVQAMDRAGDPESAFDGASGKVQRALARVQGKRALAAGRQRTRAHAHAPVMASRPATAAPQRRRRSTSDRTPMALETARRAPAHRAVKAKARRAKHRIGVQRAAPR